MNKEDLIFELKKRCSFWLNNKTISKKHALECLLGILENEKTQPSLPSNLDEAAEDFYKEIEHYPLSLPLYNKHVKDAFKTGAEWLAEQGQTFETIMQEADVDELVPTCPDMYNYGYSCGDKVIVQIRKKQ